MDLYSPLAAGEEGAIHIVVDTEKNDPSFTFHLVDFLANNFLLSLLVLLSLVVIMWHL